MSPSWQLTKVGKRIPSQPCEQRGVEQQICSKRAQPRRAVQDGPQDNDPGEVYCTNANGVLASLILVSIPPTTYKIDNAEHSQCEEKCPRPFRHPHFSAKEAGAPCEERCYRHKNGEPYWQMRGRRCQKECWHYRHSGQRTNQRWHPVRETANPRQRHQPQANRNGLIRGLHAIFVCPPKCRVQLPKRPVESLN